MENSGDETINLFPFSRWVKFIAGYSELAEYGSHMFGVNATVIGNVLLTPPMNIHAACCIYIITKTERIQIALPMSQMLQH